MELHRIAAWKPVFASLLILLLFPHVLLVEHSDLEPSIPAEALTKTIRPDPEELMADDDLIVWKPSSPDDCADEELTDIDCSAIGLGGGGGAGGGAGADGQRQPPSMQARSKDALIYPATKILTRKTTTVPTTTRRRTTKVVTARPFGSDRPCLKDCLDLSTTTAPGIESATTFHWPPSAVNRTNPIDKQPPRSDIPDELLNTRSSSSSSFQKGSGKPDVAGDSSSAGNGSSTPALPGSRRSSGFFGFDDNYQLAVNMNIILIAGIVAGIVILLFIIFIAACKFSQHSAKAPPPSACSKSDRAAKEKDYAYEACNVTTWSGGTATGPAGCKLVTAVDKLGCNSPLIEPVSAAVSSSAPSSFVAVDKPATTKRNVKEWYV